MLALLRFLRRTYDFFTRHYVLSAFVTTLPGHWFVLLKLQGTALGLMQAGGQLSRGGELGFWVCFPVSLAYALLKTVGDRQNEEAKDNGQFLLAKVLSKIRLVNRKKFNRYDTYAQGAQGGGEERNWFHNVLAPREQIGCLLEELQGLIVDVCELPQENTAVSLIFKHDGDDGWRWLPSVNVSDDLDLGTLTGNVGTTFRELVDGKKKSVFYADKRVAIKTGHYLAGQRDTSNNNVGSIYCRDLAIGNDRRYVHAVLSISTFGNQLCEVDDTESIQRIETIIMPAFEEGLRYELCMLHLKESVMRKAPGGQRVKGGGERRLLETPGSDATK